MTAKKPAKKAPVSKKPAKRKSKAKTAKITKTEKAKKAKQEKPAHPLMLNDKDWNRELVMNHICEQLATSSLGLGNILKAGYEGKPLPAYSTIMLWLEQEKQEKGLQKGLSERYARAKEDQADFMADEIVDIADNQVLEPILVKIGGEFVALRDADGSVVRAPTKIGVEHARLRVESRKWLASKLKAKKYGDRTTLAGDKENPLAVLAMSEITDSPNSRIELKKKK